MDEIAPTVSKVLVQDNTPEHLDRIKIFCNNNNLIGVRINDGNIMDVLGSKVDLGAIFLSENTTYSKLNGAELGYEIHKIRPELPIILRRDDGNIIDNMDEQQKSVFCAIYDIDEIDILKSVINEHIFSLYYPNALVRGIEELTVETLKHTFDNVEISVSQPYLIKDRIIYGQLFSLMGIESNWCRGYMMLQSDEDNVTNMVKSEMINHKDYIDFRSINDVLSEITNMIWGGIKARYISDENIEPNKVGTQVPIIVNHQHKYITFGTDIPQLCFKYTLIRKNTNGEGDIIALYQKFVFNLNWEPEKFNENQPSVDDLVDTGELEFF